MAKAGEGFVHRGKVISELNKVFKEVKAAHPRVPGLRAVAGGVLQRRQSAQGTAWYPAVSSTAACHVTKWTTTQLETMKSELRAELLAKVTAHYQEVTTEAETHPAELAFPDDKIKQLFETVGRHREKNAHEHAAMMDAVAGVRAEFKAFAARVEAFLVEFGK